MRQLCRLKRCLKLRTFIGDCVVAGLDYLDCTTSFAARSSFKMVSQVGSVTGDCPSVFLLVWSISVEEPKAQELYCPRRCSNSGYLRGIYRVAGCDVYRVTS